MNSWTFPPVSIFRLPNAQKVFVILLIIMFNLAGSTGDSCDIVTNSPEIELTSPGFPGNYQNLQDCEYEIQKSNSLICGLELIFVKFDIESNDGCHRDYFLADGQKFCGTLPTVQTRKYSIFIVFNYNFNFLVKLISSTFSEL